MHEVLVNCLGGLSLPRKSVVRLAGRSDMTIAVYCGCKTTLFAFLDDVALPKLGLIGVASKECSGLMLFCIKHANFK